jgi:hypothetical protein
MAKQLKNEEPHGSYKTSLEQLDELVIIKTLASKPWCAKLSYCTKRPN